MTDIQLPTIVITLLAILGSVYSNRKSVEDMRDVLRAEQKTQGAELTTVINKQGADLREHFNGQFADMRATLVRIENKLDHYAETQASHSERLDRLDKGGNH